MATILTGIAWVMIRIVALLLLLIAATKYHHWLIRNYRVSDDNPSDD